MLAISSPAPRRHTVYLDGYHHGLGSYVPARIRLHLHNRAAGHPVCLTCQSWSFYLLCLEHPSNRAYEFCTGWYSQPSKAITGQRTGDISNYPKRFTQQLKLFPFYNPQPGQTGLRLVEPPDRREPNKLNQPICIWTTAWVLRQMPKFPKIQTSSFSLEK